MSLCVGTLVVSYTPSARYSTFLTLVVWPKVDRIKLRAGCPLRYRETEHGPIRNSYCFTLWVTSFSLFFVLPPDQLEGTRLRNPLVFINTMRLALFIGKVPQAMHGCEVSGSRKPGLLPLFLSFLSEQAPNRLSVTVQRCAKEFCQNGSHFRFFECSALPYRRRFYHLTSIASLLLTLNLHNSQCGLNK